MTGRETSDCTRCGRTLQPGYRFCPECGLPSAGDAVLSSQITALRERRELREREARNTAPRPWRRFLLPTSSAVMLTVVLLVGLVLFNRPLVETLFPPAVDDDAPLEIAPRWEPQWVTIAPGTFHRGPPFDLLESELDVALLADAAESVRIHRITNRRWLDFVLENERDLRARGLWRSIVPGYGFGWRREPPLTGRPRMPVDGVTGEPLADRLVEGVDEQDVREYWRWFTGTAEFQIGRLGITNERWFEFLAFGRERWSAEEWDEALPDPVHGWGVEPDGLPGLPRLRVSDDEASDGDAGTSEVSDHAGPVEGVEARAVDAFRNWVLAAAESDGFPTNAHWRAFLVLEEDALRSAAPDGSTLWDAALPPPETGWMLDEDNRPRVPHRVELGPDVRPLDVPDPTGRLASADTAALERFREWARSALTGVPANEHWRAFLLSEEQALREKGLWDAAVPSADAGWGRTADGLPTMPCHAEIERSASGGRDRWLRVVDELALVAGVEVDAVRRFHEWRSLWEIPYAFEISRYEVRNALWRDFLDAEEASLRATGVWDEAVPGTRGGWVRDANGTHAPPAGALDKPVRNVSPRAVREFARWLTARLGEPGVEIRMPRPAEWEYAARGSGWRVYPWGNEFLGTPAEGTGDPKVRTGIDENSALQVDAVDEDITEGTGIVALGVNVSEWVEELELPGSGRPLHDEVRGASFGTSPELARIHARVWERRQWEDRVQHPLTGVRLVKWRPAGR